MPVPIIVITGATSGLGRLAALELARRGARLVLTARSTARADETRRAIASVAPDAAVDVVLGDLARLEDVRRLGREIADRYPVVDVLINNAGLHAFEARTTPDGHPEMIAVNYLAPWLLTHTLRPALERSPAARVVTVGSEASRRHGRLRIPEVLTDLTPFGARESSLRYGASKLLAIMFSLELARRVEGTSITANCLDPGFNVTGLGRELSFAAPLHRALTALRIGDPARGAGLIVDLAVAPDLADRTGEYRTVRGHRALTPAAPGDDPDSRARLWQETALLLDPLLHG